MTARFHVITGGPGAGKSSLIEALAADGFGHIPESGRAIIRDQLDIGGTALPWADRNAFATLMLERDMRSYREAPTSTGHVFFDRGIPDIIGYRRLCGLPVSARLMRVARLFRYSDRVFIAPPWPAIFTQDAERKQTFAEAEATFEAMVSAYAQCGYDLVTLPLATVTQRASFIRSHIS